MASIRSTTSRSKKLGEAARTCVSNSSANDCISSDGPDSVARKPGARATQQTIDDGIIKEDKLGLDVIYLQAKRWSNTVHRPEIDKFIGALTRQRARKGVFITTSDFSAGAREAAIGLDMKVVLIDGPELARLMVENNLGCSVKQVFEVKHLDSDYFVED